MDELNDLELEKRLRKELEEILEGSFDGILVTDKDGKILFVNSSYERVAEIKKSEMENKSMRDLINPEWMPNSVAYVVAEKKKPVSIRQVVKSGRHIMVTGMPIFDEQGEIKKIVINARDISEIYNLTEKLEQSKETARLYSDRFTYDDASEIEKEGGIVAISKEMRELLRLAEKAAPFQTTVLILGDSGVGKEEVAKFIHKNSNRSQNKFIAVNCGAIPHDLLESELFGYEKGAFTGAMQSGKKGLAEAAEGGTLFLDEISETSLEFQVKLLRFLETKEIRRVGGLTSKTVDVRVIAATNKNLREMVQQGRFREDLYYRLNVVQISVPPLVKRIDDIVPLAMLFLNRYNKKYLQEKKFTSDVLTELENHQWTGNVRELKNVIENMVIVSNNEYLQTEDLPWFVPKRRTQIEDESEAVTCEGDLTLAQATEKVERIVLEHAIKKYKTTREIAKALDVNQSTIVRKLQKYHLREK